MTHKMSDERFDRELGEFLAWHSDDVADAPSAAEMGNLVSSHVRTRTFGLPLAPELAWIVVAGLLILGLLAAAAVGSQLFRSELSLISPTQSPIELGIDDTPVEPGVYSALLQGYRYTFKLPAGWTTAISEDELWILKDSGFGDTAFLFSFGELRDVPVDACQGTVTYPGPTADDYAVKLAAVSGFEVSGPVDVVLDGHQGKFLVLRVPDDVNFDDCKDGAYHGIAGRYAYHQGDVDEVRILDLDGHRHILQASYQEGVPNEMQAELEDIVDSLQIEPVSD